MDRLKKAQKNVLRHIFVEKEREEIALEKEKIAVKIFERWLNQTLFKKEYEANLSRCQRRSEQTIAVFKESAAVQLIALTTIDTGTVARSACLDIMNMEVKTEEKRDDAEKKPMRPETQEAIMKIMAEENKNQ